MFSIFINIKIMFHLMDSVLLMKVRRHGTVMKHDKKNPCTKNSINGINF
jgi:hypothetical protein